MKHTPGPWHSDCGCIYAECQMDERGMTRQMPLAEVTSDEDHDDHYEGNCRLIAAAPDLLEALRQIVRQHGQWNNGIWAANIARAAIAKAEGAA